MGQPRLDLDICATGPGQEALPVSPAGAHPPDKELSALQDVGGSLDEPISIGAYGGYPAPLAIGHVEEEIHRLRDLRGTADIQIQHALFTAGGVQFLPIQC